MGGPFRLSTTQCRNRNSNTRLTCRQRPESQERHLASLVQGCSASRHFPGLSAAQLQTQAEIGSWGRGHPKLFRRQIRYFVSALNHLVSGSVADFILSQKDPWVKTADLLHNPNLKSTSKTGNLGILLDKKGQFTVSPGDIVFFEKPSTLVDAKGKKIASWK
jgi:hypothetical protein